MASVLSLVRFNVDVVPMQLILLLVIHSLFFGFAFYYFIFNLDEKLAWKSSYMYLLLRSTFVLVFSASSGYLIGLWSNHNQIWLLVLQFVPGIAVFAMLDVRRRRIQTRQSRLKGHANCLRRTSD